MLLVLIIFRQMFSTFYCLNFLLYRIQNGLIVQLTCMTGVGHMAGMNLVEDSGGVIANFLPSKILLL